MVYSHALESFLAFLFAALQAPDCVIGWIHRYELAHLKSLVQKINAHERILSKIRAPVRSWRDISNTIMTFILKDKAKEKRIKAGFAEAWRRFADDFVHEPFVKEYNSIKHGLRVRGGGFILAIGVEERRGVPAPPDSMVSLGGSQFGSTFYMVEKFDKYNFRLRRYSRNWQLEHFYFGTHLLAMSLQDVIAFLLVANGENPDVVDFVWPIDFNLFKAPWRNPPLVLETSIDNALTQEQISPCKDTDILSFYRREAT